MEDYDPLRAPAKEEWLDIDDLQRTALVENYHRRARVGVPNMKLHATLHVIVENQAALGDETPVSETLARLVRERVDRHQAILPSLRYLPTT